MIRVTNNKDFEKFKNLWELSFSNSVEIDYLKWKYRDFNYSIVDEKKDTFISFYGGIKLKCILNGEIIDIINITDSCSHPNYRSYHIFKKTVEYFYTSFDTKEYIHYGFPGIRHHKLGKLKLNYIDFKNQFNLHSIKRIENNKRLFQENTKIKKINNIIELKSFKNNIMYINKKYQNFSLLRDYDFIKWRFFEKPGNNYLFYIHIENDKMMGYICYEIKNGFTYIIDILYNREIDILKSLLTSIKCRGNIKFYTSDFDTSNQLIDLGFIIEDMDLDIKAVYRDNNRVVDNFYQTLADTDIF